jgi:hypothetical protein
MSTNPTLLQTLLTIMHQDHPSGFFLNKQFDVYSWAQKLFNEIENKRSAVTAITREHAKLFQNNLKFSPIKHESRINTLYRLIGLPTEIDVIESPFTFSDANGNNIVNNTQLEEALLQREYEQLQLTFKQFLESNSVNELNAQINSTEAQDRQLIAQLFDPNYLRKNISRLFPIIQYSRIKDIVEAKNRIAPAFASIEERYVNEGLTSASFLESVITIRLLPQSGGSLINTQGAVEDIIIQSLGYSLGELAKQYHRNQVDAEKLLLDGIAKIRDKFNGANSASLKKADIDANTREPDGITTEGDIRSQYTQAQITLYEAAISLLPLENDIIPIGNNIGDTPFKSRNIKDNALTASFIEIINSNLAAFQRIIQENKKTLQKRQLVQDKLQAEVEFLVGSIGGISMAEIIIVLSALFVMDEQDLVGLIPKSRFDQIIAASNNNTTTSSSSIQNSTAQKQLNIFDILKQFKDSRTITSKAVQILQETVKQIYVSFVDKLGTSHNITTD